MRQYRKIAHKYDRGANTNDVIYYYGVAKAYDMVQILMRAGKNPTRASVMRVARHMNWLNPFMLKGVRTKTGGADQFPLDQMRVIRYQSGTWTPISPLIKGKSR